MYKHITGTWDKQKKKNILFSLHYNFNKYHFKTMRDAKNKKNSVSQTFFFCYHVFWSEPQTLFNRDYGIHITSLNEQLSTDVKRVFAVDFLFVKIVINNGPRWTGHHGCIIRASINFEKNRAAFFRWGEIHSSNDGTKGNTTELTLTLTLALQQEWIVHRPTYPAFTGNLLYIGTPKMFAKPAFRVFSTHRGVLKVGAVYKQFLEKRIITGHAAKAVIFNTSSFTYRFFLFVIFRNAFPSRTENKHC